MEKQIIWYNPDSKKYEKGVFQGFLNTVSKSERVDDFEIIFELNTCSAKLAEKLISELNNNELTYT